MQAPDAGILEHKTFQDHLAGANKTNLERHLYKQGLKGLERGKIKKPKPTALLLVRAINYLDE